MMNEVPHLALPIRLSADGSFETVDQDSLEEIAQNVEVLLLTEIGSRIEVPDYGVPSMVFATDINDETILALIEEWEPRASAFIKEEPDRVDELIRRVRATVARVGEDA